MKTLTNSAGKTFKMGRRRPTNPTTHLQLSSYVKNGADQFDSMVATAPVLGEVLCNDKLGCCTASAAFHIDGMMLDDAGEPVMWTDEQVIAFYAASTGYVPGDDSTDQGGEEVTVLDTWKQKGLLTDGSHPIAGCLAVSPTDVNEIKTALALFRNLYFGVGLPEAWLDPMPETNGFVWDVAGPEVDENGHAFCGIPLPSEDGVVIDTWGLLGTITWAAIAKYCSENAGGHLFTIISKDVLMKATMKAPDGLDWNTLVADFDKLGGTIQA